MVDKNPIDLFDDLDLNLTPSDNTDGDLEALLGELNLQLSPEETPEPDILTIPAPKASDKKPVQAKANQPAKPAPRASERRREKADESDAPGFLGALIRHRGIINTCLALIALVLALGIAALILLQGRADPFNGLILNNVSVAGVNVGGMSVSNAESAVKQAVGDRFSQTDMVVTLGESQVVLSPAATHAVFHAADAVEAAHAFGRTGSTSDRQRDAQEAMNSGKEISLAPYLGIDEAYIRSVLEEETAKIGREFVPSRYTLEGKQPALDADSFNESAPCQILMLTIGYPGSNADMDAVVNTVLDAYSRGEFQVTIPLENLATLPEPLDLDAIHEAVTIKPVEATQNKQTNEVTSGSCGYTFNLEAAREKLDEASFGDLIAIPMEYIKPAKLDIYGDFPETLGSYSTALSSNTGYNQNMELICKSIDGIVLQPGEAFSFNIAAIARTAANGFVSAPTHDIYCSTEDVNAGADQVATTLYVSAINADLTILERHNADHACGYTMLGAELTVAHKMDLKFRNTQSTPIKIRAKVSDTQVVIRILGQRLPDYTIALENDVLSKNSFGTAPMYLSSDSGHQDQEVLFEGLDGGQVQLYRVKYDRATQQEISRTRETFVEIRPASKRVAYVK